MSGSEEAIESNLRKVNLFGFEQLCCTCTVHSNTFAFVKFIDGLVYLKCPSCDTEWGLQIAVEALNREVGS